jgi:flagellar basal-body rod modification protein FlgD
MSVAINPTQAGAANQPAPKTAAAFNSFGSAQFMQMLMTQLTHQNPLEPMDDSQMMSQFSQLNSLQELQTIKSAVVQMSAYNQTSYAASLIGKFVRAGLPDGRQIEGVVTGVGVVDGSLQVQIGEETANLENVIEIKGV